MEKGVSQNRGRTEWWVLYREAIFSKADSCEKVKRIDDAEEAIGERMHAIFRERGAEVEGEREALDDAMYALKAWRNALETKIRAA